MSTSAACTTSPTPLATSFEKTGSFCFLSCVGLSTIWWINSSRDLNAPAQSLPADIALGETKGERERGREGRRDGGRERKGEREERGREERGREGGEGEGRRVREEEGG